MLARTLLARLALAVLLLFAQQQAIQHELQHGIDALSSKSDPASPLHEVCLKCVAFAGLDHSPSCDAPTFAVPEFAHALVAVVAAPSRTAQARALYQSRAPPFLS
jgi:hypothetical protein